MIEHHFLLLCLLLSAPGALIFALRPDLRRPMMIMSLCSLPFAFTEFLFYPTYWEPKFLFDLADRIGFGIEDFLFVIALAAFTSTAYPFCFRKKFEPLDRGGRKQVCEAAPGGGALKTCKCTSPLGRPMDKFVARLAMTIGSALVATAVCALVGIPIIWACPVIMTAIAAAIWILRRDLLVPSLLGGATTLVVYFLACLALGAIVPDVFDLSWHADQFWDVFILGVPIEELTYSAAAGLIATCFYPFVFSARLINR